MKLRVDPWDPEYGGSIELEPDMGPPPALDLGVEVDGAWSPVAAPAPRANVCCAFVDGVRRIDVRLFAEDGDAAAPALAGSWAVGVAWSSLPPTDLGRPARARARGRRGAVTRRRSTVEIGGSRPSRSSRGR